jgi:flagellar biosynthesis protein FlhF
MQLRTFLGKDMKEAISAMRVELGEEAIIVASEKMKDGTTLLRAGIEGTQKAAATSEEESRRTSTDAALAVGTLGSFDARYREALVIRLRVPRTDEPSHSRPFDRDQLDSVLRTHRTPDALCEVLVDAAEESGIPDLTLALAAALDRFMQSSPPTANDPIGTILVGSPGAGKTAVAAKLAAQHRFAGMPVVLAATDTQTAGQMARLENFAACLDVPLVIASTPEILSEEAHEASYAGAFLIADCAGCDPRGPLSPDLVRFLAVGRLQIVGVVSAACDAEEAGDIADALAKLGATKLIVTGLDLARRKGALVALACSGIGLAQVTASPYLADGLETLTPLALSRALLAGAASRAVLADDAGGIKTGQPRDVDGSLGMAGAAEPHFGLRETDRAHLTTLLDELLELKERLKAARNWSGCARIGEPGMPVQKVA